jgi:hypothetical protein
MGLSIRSASASRGRRPRLMVLITGLAISALALSAVSVLPSSTVRGATTPISQGKPTTASSIENAGTPAANATDGNAGTRWSSAFSDPQWLQVDLGATTAITQVVLIWEAAYAKSFQIQTSPNGTTWTSIYSTTTGTGGTQTLNITGSGRYVRMYGTVRATGYGYSLWEFQVFAGVPPTPTPTVAPTATPAPTGTAAGCGTVNFAQGKTATASSIENAGTPASAAVDGSTTTRWSSAASDPQWIQIDLGSTQTICKVVLNWEVAYGKAFSIDVSANATAWTSIYSTTTATGGVQTLTVSGVGRYIRMYGTARGTVYGYSLWEFQVFVGGPTPTPTPTGAPTPTPVITPTPTTGVCSQPAAPNFGPNMHIFDTTMSAATIQTQLTNDFNLLKDTVTAQFAENRAAEVFKPGTYNVTANVGFYESIAGAGLNPTDVVINGDVTVDAFNSEDAGNATQNFWRSAENLTINPSSGADRWGVAQAAPLRRIQVNGGLNLFPASYGWASGGYISDVKVTGQASSVEQQQWYSKNSNFGSWSGSVWNMVFSGVTGAPAASFPTPPMTVLATTPVSRDVPYLYWTGSAWNVFVPSLQTNKSGTSWPNTPGTSLPMTQFFVVTPGATTAQITGALANGCNLFFTPGVYHVNQTLNVTKANTVVMGIGYPTIVNDNGVDAMHVADVDGIRLKGLLFDAGTTQANTQLTIGTAGNTTSHASNPTTIQDVFFRVGGEFAGKVTYSLTVNSYDTIIDHIWAWRADHGAGVGWTSNTADTGLTVNGNNVLATGLFVEHYQKWDVVWNGQNGKTIFFQNEIGYDEPNQASFMDGTTNGYAAYKVATNVTTHEAWGLGSYILMNADPTIVVDHAFQAPNTTNVKFHNLTTISLGKGQILHVINNVGGATPITVVPVTVTSYP